MGVYDHIRCAPVGPIRRAARSCRFCDFLLVAETAGSGSYRPCLPRASPDPSNSIAGSPNLVVNGGFDTPRITGRHTVSTLAGWLVSGPVELVASPSCGAVPASGQYVALGYGASISQAVSTVPGKLYQLQAYESMEGVCNIAGTVLDTYWNSTLAGSTTTLATGTDPRRGGHRMGAYDTFTPAFIASPATSRFVSSPPPRRSRAPSTLPMCR